MVVCTCVIINGDVDVQDAEPGAEDPVRVCSGQVRQEAGLLNKCYTLSKYSKIMSQNQYILNYCQPQFYLINRNYLKSS